MKVLYLAGLFSLFLHEFVTGDVLTIAAKKALVKTHNDHRRRLAKGEELNKESKNMPKAANMMKMFYNKDLEKKADEWLKKCQFARVPGVEGGQNLYMVSSAMEQEAVVVRAAESWWSDLPKKYATTSVDFSSLNANEVGHFTQMAWAKNRRVGCAVQKCDSGTMVVCLYGTGNVAKENVYEIGEPCSGCAEGTYCEDALCVMNCQKQKKK